MKDFEFKSSPSIFIATAIHSGHHIRRELWPYLQISEEDRLREEDPFTNLFTDLCLNRVLVNTSRFEVDLNRPLENCVYKTSHDSWGLDVWKKSMPQKLLKLSYDKHIYFYDKLANFLKKKIKEHGKVIILDIHSYNYRRNHESYEYLQGEKYPDINIGTASMNRNNWSHLLDPFISTLKNESFFERNLVVAENKIFMGGYMSQWIHKNFPNNCCSISIEFKKIFMDEWTGEMFDNKLNRLKEILKVAILSIKTQVS
ncbi:MAG: N-formylglutamate amidohydrolase [Pseudomonadota bacterium]